MCALAHSAVSDSLRPHRTVAHQAPLSVGFFRQESWRGLALPPPADLPDPGISSLSCILQGDCLSAEPMVKPRERCRRSNYTRPGRSL